VAVTPALASLIASLRSARELAPSSRVTVVVSPPSVKEKFPVPTLSSVEA
jgi:hypothetical protein